MASLDPRYAEKARALFDTYATGFNPGSSGISFWADKFANSNANEDAILQEFLNPAQGAAAPRYAAMQADPDYQAKMGLMSLPGSTTTVANPTVLNNLASQVNPQAAEMFNLFATGYTPDTSALQFWSDKIGNLGYQNALQEFLNPKDVNAPRSQTMLADPEYLTATGRGPASQLPDEEFKQAMGLVGEKNRLELDRSLRDWYNVYTGGKGMANPVDAYVSMLSGRDKTYLSRDYEAAKQKMLDDAVKAGLYGAKPGSYSTGAFDSWLRQQTQNQASIPDFVQQIAATSAATPAVVADSKLAKDPFPDKITTGYIPESFVPEAEIPVSQQIELPIEQAVTTSAQPTQEQAKEQAKELFETYATGFDPGQKGIDYWAEQLSKPGATTESVVEDFLNPTDPNAPRTFYMQSDPDYIAAKKEAMPEVDKTGFEKFEGVDYDPKAYNNIVKQLTAQQKVLTEKAKIPYESTLGSTQETIADMAKRLAAMGISDIRDFGMRHELPVEKVYETISQDEGPSLTFDTGKYRTISGVKGKGPEGETVYEYRELTPDEVKRLQFRDDSGVGFLPIPRQDTKKLYDTPFATTTYFNKKTGQVLDTQKFGGKAESGIFASTGAGRGYTDYRVMFDSKGTPIFIPQKEKSGMDAFVAKDLPGILSVLRFLPGAAPYVMAAQVAGALHQGAKPADIAKRVIPTLIASNLDKIAGATMKGLDIPLPTSDVGKLAMQGGLGALSSLIQGGDLEDALRSGALSAASSGISSLLPKPEAGGIDYSRLIRAAAPSIARGRLSNADVFRMISALAPTKKRTPGKP